jgi:hypothetical protein
MGNGGHLTAHRYLHDAPWLLVSHRAIYPFRAGRPVAPLTCSALCSLMLETLAPATEEHQGLGR